MIDREEYLERIRGATPAQRVSITFELAENFLSRAIEAKNTEKEMFAHYVSKTKNCLTQLIGGLDFNVPMARDLYEIYLYIYKLLTRAYFRYGLEEAEEGLSLLAMLKSSFDFAAEQESGVFNSEEKKAQVFAGLTYRRGGLSEYVEQDHGRGYTV